MAINFKNQVLTDINTFTDNIQGFLPTLKRESVFNVIKKVIDVTTQEDFYTFYEGKGDYPDFFFMPSEIAIKQNIYSSFKKEPVKSLGFARYELIDMALEKFKKKNPNIEKEFYFFLMMIEHLFIKLLMHSASSKDLLNLYKIFTSNLDYMLISYDDPDNKSNLALRTILLPSEYLNKETNTIGYNKNIINPKNISLVLDFNNHGVNEPSGLVLEIFKILEGNQELTDLAKVKFIELSTVFICLIMYLSNEVVTVCNECGEIYIDFKSGEKNICSECYNHKHGLNKMLIFKHN